MDAEVKMTSNPVYGIANIKPQDNCALTTEKKIEIFPFAKKGMFFIIIVFGLFLLSLLIAVLAVTVYSSRQIYSSSRKPVYSSCADIAASSPSSVSGYYVIQSSNGSHIQVYCEMGPVCGGGRRGWTRAIHEQYFNLINIRSNSCVTYDFFANFGVKYNHLCVQLRSSLFNSNRQYVPFYQEASINESYVRGISITHGSPRQHILSLSFEWEDGNGDEYSIPEFVGSDYIINNCVYSLNPCYFHILQVSTNLEYTTIDDVEVRICNGISYNNFYHNSYHINKLIILLQ